MIEATEQETQITEYTPEVETHHRRARQNPYVIAHIAETYKCYPGEDVVLHTRVDAVTRGPGLVVRISVPESADILDYTASVAGQMPAVEVGPLGQFMVWRTEADVRAGERQEFTLRLHVRRPQPLPWQMESATMDRNEWLESTARAYPPEEPERTAEDSVAIAVYYKGNYLHHLPALYEHDQFVGRFLMLFESFWSPIEQQIGAISEYFDPDLTPPGMVPWLAWWFSLTLDEHWPEAKQRRLLSNIVRLYRKRGTKPGLREMLEIFTDGEVEIAEHRADNFRLGRQARLGQGVAVGRQNRPHTFTVKLKLPPLSPSPATKAERKRLEKQRLNLVRAIIEAEKPAHAVYTLDVD